MAECEKCLENVCPVEDGRRGGCELLRAEWRRKLSPGVDGLCAHEGGCRGVEVILGQADGVYPVACVLRWISFAQLFL